MRKAEKRRAEPGPECEQLCGHHAAGPAGWATPGRSSGRAGPGQRQPPANFSPSPLLRPWLHPALLSHPRQSWLESWLELACANEPSWRSRCCGRPQVERVRSYAEPYTQSVKKSARRLSLAATDLAWRSLGTKTHVR